MLVREEQTGHDLGKYILMASKCKDNNWQTAESRNCALPMDHANRASIFHRVSFDKLVHNQDNQIGHGHQGRNTSILQRIQAAQIGNRNHDQPEVKWSALPLD